MEQNNKRYQGIDRRHHASLITKLAFFLFHGVGVALSAYVVWGNGLSVVGGWFGKVWSVTEHSRAQWMLAVIALYWLRHGITLFYLLQRKVEWSEVLPLSLFLILFGPISCSLAGGITRTTPAVVDAWFYVALALIAVGSYLNTASEVQRKWWKADPANKGRCYTEGLFRYSMHINYFGDLVSFSGWALLTGVVWSVLVLIGMTAGFVFSQIPGLDAYLEDRYGDEFRDYAKRTKKLVPFLY